MFSSEFATRCNRCEKLDRECIPHVSRQGKRPNKREEVASSAYKPWSQIDPSGTRINRAPYESTGTVHSAQLAGNTIVSNNSNYFGDASLLQLQNSASLTRRADQSTFTNLQIPIQASEFSLPRAHGLQGQINYPSMFPPNHRIVDQRGVPMPTATIGVNVYPVSKRSSSSAIASDQAQLSSLATVVEQHADDIADTSLLAIREGHSSCSIMTMRQWIKVAVGSNAGDGISRLSPEYISACLAIAKLLSKQISDAEELKDVSSLPYNYNDWAAAVTVRTGKQSNYVIESAELISDNTAKFKSSKDDTDLLLSKENQRQRIYALGITFFELFSGGKVYDEQFIVSRQNNLRAAPSGNPQEINDQLESFLEIFERDVASKTSNGSQGQSVHVSSETDSELLREVFGCEKEGNNVFELKSFSPLSPLLSPNHTLDVSNKSENKEEDNGMSPRETFNSNNNCGARKKSQEFEGRVVLNPLIESLTTLGISIPLVDLINNMLDCINGDLCGKDAYNKMSEIVFELTLMIDKPNTFLHEPDMSNLSLAGFQLKDDLFMKGQEYAALENAYRRFKSGSSEELVAISGSSGVGKSYLVSHLSRVIEEDRNIFLSVKFDQLQQANPSAFLSAFNDYCSIFVKKNSASQIELMATKLRHAVGQDGLSDLIKVMPELCNIVGHDLTDSLHRHDCVNGQKKIGYLITKFVETMTVSTSNEPLTLCLDDTQWIDNFSMSVLEQIAMMPASSKHIFIIVCYRDDDYHPFKRFMNNWYKYELRPTRIHLECMSKDAVNTLVSDLLSLPPRLVRSLSDIIYQKTKGDGCLHLSLRRKRW